MTITGQGDGEGWRTRLARDLRAREREMTDPGEVSDGFHTFNELYRYRMLYNAALFSHWATHDRHGMLHHEVHKSWRHHDGKPCFFGGWFIVMATLPTGQISNHYPAEHWDLFRIPATETADEWDGHTPTEAADRLEAFLRRDPL